MKKIISVITAALILACVLPFGAAAAVKDAFVTEDPATLVPIDAVELGGITPPAAGESPEYNVTLPAGASYSKDYSQDGTGDEYGQYYIKNAVQWLADGYCMPFDAKFEYGVNYGVCVFLKAASGRCFDESTTATINGTAADNAVVDPADNTFMYVYYSYPALVEPDVTEIISVILTGSVKSGTVLDSSTLAFSGEEIDSIQIDWYKGETALESGANAINGEYTAVITAYAKPYYELTTQTVFKALGGGGAPDYVSVDGTYAYYTAKVNVKCDHSYNTNGYYHDDETHKVFCSECGALIFEEAHVFDGGVRGDGEMVYTCTECGYSYGEPIPSGPAGEVRISIPAFGLDRSYGDIVRGTEVTFENGAPYLIAFTFTADDGSGEEKVTVVYDVASGNYSLAGGGAAGSALEKFIEPYVSYSLEIELRTDDIIEPADVNVVGSGITECLYTVEDYGRYLNAFVDCGTLTDKISHIEISGVSLPVMGEEPDTSAYCDVYGVNITEVRWNATGKFTCKQDYTLQIFVELSDNYDFAEELTVSIEGFPEASVSTAVTEDGRIIAGIDCVIPPADHTFGEWTVTKEAGEFEAGERERVCTVCGEKETEEIKAAHEHKYVTRFDSTGHWSECECGEKTKVSSHKMGSWKTVKEAEVGVEGSKERKCSKCGYTETEVIPALEPAHEHSYIMRYDEEGHWGECECGDKTGKFAHDFGEDRVCSACGYALPAEDISEEPSEPVSETEPVSEPEPASETEPEPASEPAPAASQDTGDGQSEAGGSPVITEPTNLDWLWITLGVIVCGACGVGAWYVLKKRKPASDTDPEDDPDGDVE